MAGFVVLNNMAYGVMKNEKHVVLSTNVIAHSYRYMAFGMGQCMNATIATYSRLWCVMQPYMQHGKDFTA
jgi:hypothetical protein